MKLLPNYHSLFPRGRDSIIHLTSDFRRENQGHPTRTCMLSHFSQVWLLATLWTIAHQAPLCMVFSRQRYRMRLPCPLPGDLPNPGIKLASLMSPELQAVSLSLALSGKPHSQYTQPPFSPPQLIFEINWTHCQSQLLWSYYKF